MLGVKPIRTSLEVGFPDGGPGERLLGLRGREFRSVALLEQFPYADAQFEVVLMHGSAVNRKAVKEAHRVLCPEGRLYFMVPEKTKKQEGFTLPEIYSIVREGFNIIEVERPSWWLFGARGRTITICAQKKNWRAQVNTYRPLV